MLKCFQGFSILDGAGLNLYGGRGGAGGSSRMKVDKNHPYEIIKVNVSIWTSTELKSVYKICGLQTETYTYILLRET
jgi:hypothetical protein